MSGTVGGSNRISPNTWNSGATNIGAPTSTETSQGVNASVSAPVKTQPNTPTKSTPPQTQTQNTPPQSQPTISRALNQRDINQQLLLMGRPVTPENKEAMITLIRYGVETSLSNLDMVAKLRTATRHPNGTEAAVITISKGLKDAPKTVDALAGFLNRQSGIANKSGALSQGISQFQATISNFQELFSQGLFTGLSGVLSDLDDGLKKLNKKYQDNFLSLPKLERNEMIKNFQALLGFLKGTEEKVTAGRQNTALLKEAFQTLQGLTKGMIESLTAQALLGMDSEKIQMSVHEKFGYWQIPSPFGSSQNVDILIRKDPRQKKGKYDPGKTRIVLKFETKDLGEVTVIMDILDNKIWYTFHVDRLDTEKAIQELHRELINRMEAQNYKTVEIKRVRLRVDIKKMLLPTFNLNSISRVSAEI